MRPERLGPYVKLITEFLEGKILAEQFEKMYLNLFANDVTHWSEVEYLVLDKLFSDVEEFCSDPDLRDENDLDENQLRDQAQIALDKLKVLSGSDKRVGAS